MGHGNGECNGREHWTDPGTFYPRLRPQEQPLPEPMFFQPSQQQGHRGATRMEMDKCASTFQRVDWRAGACELEEIHPGRILGCTVTWRTHKSKSLVTRSSWAQWKTSIICHKQAILIKYSAIHSVLALVAINLCLLHFYVLKRAFFTKKKRDILK